jgi:formylglycine-generating enzyme required for sulfatase activity
MKKFLMFLIAVPFICMAGNLIIDFNDATPSSEINFNDIDYFEIMPSGFVSVPPGRFEMGQTGVAEPVHIVNITRKYFLGKNEVTQKEWFDIMDQNPSSAYGVGDNYPVYKVSWYSILVYCNLRSMAEGLTPCYTICSQAAPSGTTDPDLWGRIPTEQNNFWDEAVCNFDAKGYRMPTEAEWEYAARYNDERTYPWGETAPSDSLCNYGNNIGITTLVGSYPSGRSKLGLNDMSGNIYEWVWDVYEAYTGTEETDPVGPEASFESNKRVIRGGGFYSTIIDGHLKSVRRISIPPNETYYHSNMYGFRLARTK